MKLYVDGDTLIQADLDENDHHICIPEGIEWIDESVFAGCDEIESVEFPESLNYISARAFDRCKNLCSIKLPKELWGIDDDAFKDCIRLNSVVPHEHVQNYPNAFRGCFLTRSEDLYVNWERIDTGDFQGDKLLRVVTIGSGVKDIEFMAFADCENLEAVVFEARGSGKDIEVSLSAFRNCPKLKYIIIPGYNPEKEPFNYPRDDYDGFARERPDYIGEKAFREYAPARIKADLDILARVGFIYCDFSIAMPWQHIVFFHDSFVDIFSLEFLPELPKELQKGTKKDVPSIREKMIRDFCSKLTREEIEYLKKQL